MHYYYIIYLIVKDGRPPHTDHMAIESEYPAYYFELNEFLNSGKSLVANSANFSITQITKCKDFGDLIIRFAGDHRSKPEVTIHTYTRQQ